MCACKNCYRNFNPSTTILCPCPPPKRLLTSSSWISRNDSSSINAILQPDNYLSPRLKYGEKTRGHVVEKHILSRNNCYCLDTKPPKPTLFKRPNSCITYETLRRERFVDEHDLKRRSLICICSKDVEVDNEKISKPRSTVKENDVPLEDAPLQFTKQREKYEEFREKEEERFDTELDEFKRKERFLKYANNDEEESNEDVHTILGTRKYDTETSFTNYDNVFSIKSDKNAYTKRGSLPSRSSRTDLPKYHSYTVPEFRKEYYFETHDIDKVSGSRVSQGDHTCVHQFKLSDRWLPDPLNKDAFGRSRCKICEKPMEGSSVNLSTSYLFDDKKTGRSKIKNFAQAYKHGLAPRTINLGMGKSRIELLLNEKDLSKFNCLVNKSQKLEYCNSLALRHQKIRVI